MTTAVFDGAEALARPLRAFGPVSAFIILVAVAVLSLALAAAATIGVLSLFDPAALAELLDWLDLSELPAVESVAIQRFNSLITLFWGLIVAGLLFAIARLRRAGAVRHVLALGGTLPRTPLLIALGFLAVTFVAETFLANLFPHLRDLFTLPADPIALTIMIVAVVIAAPISEELLFRGLLYTSARERWGVGPSVILTSLLFAALHYEPTGIYALLVLPSAFLFGWLRERTGGIYASTLMHAAFNTAAVVGLLAERAMSGS